MIGALGELLVEFVCETTDSRNLSPARYAGPFPSGAPGIFIDQAARIAGRAIFAGAVGADAFGRVILDRLAEGGVASDLIRTVPDRPTGTAHVAYNSDGSRDFVFNIAHSAAAALPSAAEIVTGFRCAGVDLFHVSGSALSDPGMRATVMEVARALSGTARVSVDPNIRKELAGDPGYLDAVRELIARAAFVLPSDDDAAALWPGEGFDAFAARLIDGGAQAVVLKRGAKGCLGRDATGATVDLAALTTDVIDPTGAGDCFCGTFVALAAEGVDLPTALAHANAAGALAVSRLGPMEGNARRAEIAARLEEV